MLLVLLPPPTEGSPLVTILPAPMQLDGGHREAVFVDVTCGDDGCVYTAAHLMILYMFDRSCRIMHWVNLNAKIYALALTPTCLACTCSNGAVYLFNPESLACCSVLPRLHPLSTAVVVGTVHVPACSPLPVSQYLTSLPASSSRVTTALKRSCARTAARAPLLACWQW